MRTAKRMKKTPTYKFIRMVLDRNYEKGNDFMDFGTIALAIGHECIERWLTPTKYPTPALVRRTIGRSIEFSIAFDGAAYAQEWKDDKTLYEVIGVKLAKTREEREYIINKLRKKEKMITSHITSHEATTSNAIAHNVLTFDDRVLKTKKMKKILP